METSTLIQILVFVLAALIVVVFIASGIHFVRTVYLVQLEEERERRARQIAAHVAQRLREQQAVELKQREGVLIQQPDGAHDIALFVEPPPTPGTGASGDGMTSADGESSSNDLRASDGDSASNGHSAVPTASPARTRFGVFSSGTPPSPDQRALEANTRLGPETPLSGLKAFIAAMNSQGFRR